MNKTFYFLIGAIILLVLLAIFSPFWLTELQQIATIIASASIILAIGEYSYKRKRDKLVTVCDQVAFFREEVLSKNTELVNIIRSRKGINYKFARVELENSLENSMEEMITKHPEEYKAQLDLLKTGDDVLNIEGELLNALEELSVRIIYLETKEQEALENIKNAFVELVEIHALRIIETQELSFKSAYSKTLYLYNLWKNEVDRETTDQKIEKLRATH